MLTAFYVVEDEIDCDLKLDLVCFKVQIGLQRPTTHILGLTTNLLFSLSARPVVPRGPHQADEVRKGR